MMRRSLSSTSLISWGCNMAKKPDYEALGFIGASVLLILFAIAVAVAQYYIAWHFIQKYW